MPSGLQGRRLSHDCHNSRPLPHDRSRSQSARSYVMKPSIAYYVMGEGL